MTTLTELQTHIATLRHKRTILSHLVEHLDSEFLPELDQQPKKALLTEEKIKVPQEAFDGVAADLNTWIKSLQAEEQKLLSSTVTVTPPPAEPTPTQSEAQS